MPELPFYENPPLPPFGKGGMGGLKPLYRYCEIFPSVRSQYLYYACKFRGAAVFFQVGYFYEFYLKVREDVMAILNLREIQKNKRAVQCGFPVRLEEEFAKRLASRGIPVIIIRETDRYIGRMKERLPVRKIIKKEE
jgi:DNA mismatch repair ATPase MutS